MNAVKQQKQRARGIVGRAIARGDLVRPSTCSECGSDDTSVHAHHRDYSRPLDVEWLCRDCHVVAHGGQRAIPTALGRTIRDAGLTQAEFARRVGTTESQVSRWVRGSVEPLRMFKSEIARALGVTVWDIWPDEPLPSVMSELEWLQEDVDEKDDASRSAALAEAIEVIRQEVMSP